MLIISPWFMCQRGQNNHQHQPLDAVADAQPEDEPQV